MMRRHLLALVFIAVMATSRGVAQSQDAEAEIVGLEQRVATAWVERDRAFMERLLASDWRVIDPSGAVLTKQQVFDQTFASDDRRVEEMTVDELTVRVFCDMAVVTGRTRATGSYRGQRATAVLRFTDVLQRRGGQWLIVSSQGTRLGQ